MRNIAKLALVFSSVVGGLALPVSATAQGDSKKQAHQSLEEVIVTARKREESIQDTPVSVTPFSAAELEQRGFTGLEDIAAATPGFTFEGFITGSHGNAVIRGLAQQFTTARVQNVSFFIDGVYLQRQSMLNLGMVDMQRVEVVKGPQNALYGRNAFAGAVNYVTLKPRAEFEGYVNATVGSDERQDLRVSVNGPIGFNDRLLGKFTYGVSRYDGHTPNDHPLADDGPSSDSSSGNLGGWDDSTLSLLLALEPTDSLTLRTSFYRSELERETQPGYSLSGVNAARFGMRSAAQNDLNCNVATVPDIGNPSVTHTGFSAFCGELPEFASDVAERTKEGIIIDPRGIGALSDTNVLTASVDWEINDNWSMSYLFGYTDHDSTTNGGASDEDPLQGRTMPTNIVTGETIQVNTFSGRPNSVLEAFSHELRFDWELNSHILTSFGLYYSKVEDEEWSTVYLSALCNEDSEENRANCGESLDSPSPIASESVLTVPVTYDQGSRQHAKTRLEWTEFEDTIMGAFASFNINFTEQLGGTLEFRYSEEEKSIVRITDSFGIRDGETFTYTAGVDPIVPIPPDMTNPTQTTLSDMIVEPSDSATFRYFTPRAIINYQLAEDHMIYASAAKGVKTGGFNNAEDMSQQVYDEAENWSYEVGSKNMFMDRRLTFNVAAYYIDWTNMQGTVPPLQASLSSSDVVTNIGDATSVGIEIESVFHINHMFSIDTGLSWNDAYYDDGVKYSAAESSFHCDGVTCPADGDVSGNQLQRSSKEQASLGLNLHTALAGWAVSGRLDANYQSKQYVTPLNLAWAPARTIVNGSLNLISPMNRWEVSLWGKNLEDKQYAANSFYIGVFNQYMVGKIARRSFGSTIKYNF